MHPDLSRYIRKLLIIFIIIFLFFFIFYLKKKIKLLKQKKKTNRKQNIMSSQPIIFPTAEVSEYSKVRVVSAGHEQDELSILTLSSQYKDGMLTLGAEAANCNEYQLESTSFYGSKEVVTNIKQDSASFASKIVCTAHAAKNPQVRIAATECIERDGAEHISLLYVAEVPDFHTFYIKFFLKKKVLSDQAMMMKMMAKMTQVLTNRAGNQPEIPLIVIPATSYNFNESI